MFDELINSILEDFNIYPRAKAPMVSGPNIDVQGATPSGFKGSLGGTGNVLVVKPKLKKKKIKKKY